MHPIDHPSLCILLLVKDLSMFRKLVDMAEPGSFYSALDTLVDAGTHRRSKSWQKPPSCIALVIILLQYTDAFKLLHSRSRGNSVSGGGRLQGTMSRDRTCGRR